MTDKYRFTMMKHPIALLTDFGYSDTYAGVMKAVIHSIHPEALVIDLSHGVRPQNIMNGAFLLYTGYSFFPTGTVFCVVVDPGVGSDRRAVCVKTRNYFFVGPDNGVLWAAVTADGIEAAFCLTHTEYFLPELSRTFHGRDLFAPVCAHIARGVLPDSMGEPAGDIRRLDVVKPIDSIPGGRFIKTPRPFTVTVLHTDVFGNIVLNVTKDHLAKTRSVFLRINSRTVRSVYSFYAQAGPEELFLIAGSSGFMEISLKNGSAAEQIGVTPGDEADLFISV